MTTTRKDIIRLTTTNQATCTDLINQLEKGYIAMNKKFFKNSLPDVTITLIPDVKGNAIGWIYSKPMWHKNGEMYYELNICSDHLDRSKVEIYGTLLHEMVHIYNAVNGIKDTSRSGGSYHNKKYGEQAEKHGLSVEVSEKYGYAHTTPTTDTAKWIEENLTDLVNMYRETFKTSAKRIRVRSHSIKYVCPCCGDSARTTKEMVLVCGTCNKVMEAD